MGQQLFVLTNGALPADALTIADIVVGKAGAVVEGTNVVKAAPALGDKLQIVGKTLANTPIVSPVFSPRDIVKKSVIAASAGTAQVSNITLVVPGTQKKGDEWIVKIMDTTIGTRAPKMVSASVYHTGVDYNVGTLTDAFVTKINSLKLGVTADNNANVLRLTADNTVKAFRFAVDNMAETSTIAYTTKNTPAAGTVEVIKALEDYLQSFGNGVTNKTSVPIKQPASNVEAGATYTLYVFDMLIPVPDYAGIGSKRTASYKLYIAERDAANANHIGKLIADLV
jgi:hypothetical protein